MESDLLCLRMYSTHARSLTHMLLHTNVNMHKSNRTDTCYMVPHSPTYVRTQPLIKTHTDK